MINNLLTMPANLWKFAHECRTPLGLGTLMCEVHTDTGAGVGIRVNSPTMVMIPATFCLKWLAVQEVFQAPPARP
jgi:hypothetical protein